MSQSIESISPPQSDITIILSNSEPQLSASLPHSASLPQLDSVATLTGAGYTPESTNSVTSVLLTPPTLTKQTSMVMPSVPIPEMIVTNNIMPPPLTPVASYAPITSSANHQSPVMLSVPDARSLYTSSVDHFTHHGSFLTSAAGYHASAQQFATSRLPKLSLPTFSGNPLTWQTFWDSFYAAIDANPNLSGIQKFNYLKAQLQGDAARAIGGLPLSDLNYRHVVTLLRDHFGQPHELINAHTKALVSMTSPTNSLSSLRMFYDSVESHIRGLSSLGKSEKSYGDLLVPIVMKKLTTEVRRNLAREHSNTQ